MEIKLTAKDYDEVVLKAEKPVLIDFWATWCAPCRMIAPVVAEIAKEREDIVVCKVNVDEEPALAGKFGVNVIPTLVVMKNGQKKAQSAGFRGKAELLKLIEDA